SVLTFTGNTAANEGGVIYSTGTGIDLDFDTINFSNNQATNFGGAIRFNNTNTNYKVSITGETVTFDNNTAQKQNGGAIHTNASVQLNGTSENSVFTFSNNTAPKGNSGAIVAVGSVEFSTGSFIFQNNIAGGIAGAIEARKGITFSGYNTSATFTGNTAGTEGNDLYLSNANSVLTFMDGGTYSFDGGIYLAEDSQSTVINQAQVTIAGRSNVSNNNYQLQTVNIFNGGKLTANLDNIDSLTGKFNLGNDGSAGTLEFNVGADSAKELTQQRDMFDINGGFAGSVVKSGAGTLTLAGDFEFYGETTVSGGTLLLPAGYTLNTSKVTIETGATLQTSADLWAANVVVNNGSKFVIGETYESAEISIVELTLNGGTVHFDLNDFISYNGSYIYDMDQLFTDSVTPYSGVVDLTFNSASAEDWWQVVKNSDEGVPLIIAYDFAEEFDPDNFTVSVNGTPSNNWALAAQDDGIYLFAQGDEPTPGEPWYFANTGDIHLDSWTIDGTNKQGAQFTQGDNDATFEGGVTMDADGEFNIEANKNLTLAGEVTGEGGVTKTGEGTLTLTNANSYTGGTTISAGKVVLSENGTLGNGDIQNDATLEFAHDSDQTLDKTISGDGSVLKTGAGTLTFDVDQEYYGETTVSGGTLILPVGRNLFSSQVTIKSGGTFQLGWFIDDTDVIVEQGGNFVPAFEDCGGL
ncbi:MAG: autotransporter-associated beta strand repeat-containing protein, partial [Thermoguttaceae bacterium]|nr:autotransporter-associated beta strand repeat-containing protein [Thermoguttaceae bacterium]